METTLRHCYHHDPKHKDYLIEHVKQELTLMKGWKTRLELNYFFVSVTAAVLVAGIAYGSTDFSESAFHGLTALFSGAFLIILGVHCLCTFGAKSWNKKFHSDHDVAMLRMDSILEMFIDGKPKDSIASSVFGESENGNYLVVKIIDSAESYVKSLGLRQDIGVVYGKDSPSVADS